MSRINTLFSSSAAQVPRITLEDINTAIIENQTDKAIEMIKSPSAPSINQSISRDPYRNTLLHVAITMRNLRMIKFLIVNGADLKIKNKSAQSCADLLATSGLGEAIHYLAEDSAPYKKMCEEKSVQIESLKKDNDRLVKINTQLTTRVQETEADLVRSRKRFAEAEAAVDNLLELTKKSKK